MSLLNKNNAFAVQDYIFVAVGLLCAFGFFLSYPSQEPRNAISTELERKTATVKAVESLNSIGYNTESLQSVVTFESNNDLLNNLQKYFGRSTAIDTLAASMHPDIYPYFWQMSIKRIEGKGFDSDGPPMFNEHTAVHLDEQGDLIEFINDTNILPERSVNRDAIVAAFEADPDLKLWKSLPDSAWKRILRFDIDKEYAVRKTKADTLNVKRSQGDAHTYTKENIENLANYHISQSGWTLSNLKLSDIQIETIHSQTVAAVEFKNNKPLLGQDVVLNLTILPTGALVELDASYNPNSESEGSALPYPLELIRAGIIFLFALATIILFYFRIRLRAIDTKPALVVGVIGGLVMGSILFLQQWASTPSLQSLETSEVVARALQIGFLGALSSIVFFAAFAVGDSLVRQYWPEKLYSYDYLRQGMFFNKPIGEMILRSVVLAFILCGLWSALLAVIPELQFNIERTFLHFEAAWAPIYLFTSTVWFSLLLMIGVYSIVGTQVYGFYKNKWLAAAIMALSITIVSPFIQQMVPTTHEFIIAGIYGVVLTAIFLKWDMLTTLFTHFLLILMLESATGWVTANSPDLYVFIVFCGFLVFNIVAGMIFVTKGEERQSLPRFVPEYVEELAQEERIKQELEIAREVQQSFLPVQTPEFENLDLAAMCKPAYETGGDYYDFVKLGDHRLAVTIGDVSGKGIQAAFYMTFIKGILHSLCREIDSPAEVLKKTNRLFYDNAPRGTFISLVYGIVDMKKNTFHFARAGHNPIIRINAENHDIKELRPRGIGIGLTKGASFDDNIEELELELGKEDLLVLYTDGIVEALNEGHKFYGTLRLNNILVEHKKRSARDLLEVLSGDIYTYIGEAKQHDDMTMVIIKLDKSDT
ncbi:PP2C family protein-serine/threonine phosphatase [Fodinibius halophilus]|uniref:PP2C family protein-serine/threonine phosphatase n=1 Tax=Fodinibius halophilus TaxID=1736908 RepID=A0A6M1T3C0_9BACT|nr:PP2C family protein-serine/threonine phosphatase [Fodinibius halophilus]NGP87715.1 PP2C family protein-serine/threonine phosphatase [Fodinibius halophilus]